MTNPIDLYTLAIRQERAKGYAELAVKYSKLHHYTKEALTTGLVASIATACLGNYPLVTVFLSSAAFIGLSIIKWEARLRYSYYKNKLEKEYADIDYGGIPEVGDG